MKPVNLIPAEERRNTSVGGRSGGGAYVLLGVLVVLIALVSAYAVAGRNVDEKRSQLADTRAEAARVKAQADRLSVYQRFADLRQKRADTVTSIARSRFDWARALREVSRTLPAGVSLTAMSGSVTPSANADGAVSDPMRAALPNPALVLQGCANGQDGVAEVMSALRRMEGVQRVSLSSSKKGASSGSGDCTGGRKNRPSFSMSVFFATSSAGGTAAGAATAATGTSTTSAAPASTTSSTTPSTSTGASK